MASSAPFPFPEGFASVPPKGGGGADVKTPPGPGRDSAAEGEGGAEAADFLQPQILVVDDDPLNCELAKAFLEDMGYPISVASNGREALEVARRTRPAVIVSDWMMPEMDGMELLQAVRADPLLSGTHFVMLTARDDSDALVNVLESGADDYVTKPVGMNALRARVSVGMRISKLLRESERQRVLAEAANVRLEQAKERLRQALEKLDDQFREIIDLQAEFVPMRLPGVAGLVFGPLYRPCQEVGGDYYDVFEMPDGRVCLTIADVTGHGARASVYMAMTRALARAAATQVRRTDGPGWMFLRINRWLQSQMGLGQFVTMWMAVWDAQARELRYARCGHPPAVLWRVDKEPEYLSNVGSPPLGLMEFDQPPGETVIRLNAGDRLVLLTDGWLEAARPDETAVGIDGFLEFLKECEGLEVEAIPLSLIHQLERFVLGAAIRDDISLLAVEYRPE